MRRLILLLALLPACATDADGDGVNADEDCNDADADIYPGNTEICDGKDNDCANGVDDGVLNTYYTDSDQDNYGDPNAPVEACEPGTNQVDNDDDCDDDEPLAYPGNDEVCDDNVDNDCNGDVDEDSAIDAVTWYKDADEDDYGVDTDSRRACNPGAGWSLEAGDCDDAEAAVNPGADEICFDDIDNNCDELVDDGSAVDSTRWYADTDTDLFGDPSTSELACEQPDGFVADDTDCDDSDAKEYPGVMWYPDGDADRYGTMESDGVECERANPTDVTNNDDCDDTDNTSNPGETEVWYNDVDNDCSGGSDFDQDGDGYDSADELEGGDDCDDLQPLINPGASEAGDGIDNDCDGLCDEGFIGAGDLIVTEIMQNPSSVSDGDGEYFEVYNDSADDIVVCGGWVIKDDDSDSHTVSGGPYTITAGDWFVFGTNADTMTNGGVTVDYEYGSSWFLSNGADEVVIEFDGAVIDAVDYDGGPDYPDPAGASMNLDPDFRDATDNDDGVNWCESETEITSGGDAGTPGAANDACEDPVEF